MNSTWVQLELGGFKGYRLRPITESEISPRAHAIGRRCQLLVPGARASPRPAVMSIHGPVESGRVILRR